MKRAISLADSYKLTTKPNPVVGCLLIKDNKVKFQKVLMNYMVRNMLKLML